MWIVPMPSFHCSELAASRPFGNETKQNRNSDPMTPNSRANIRDTARTLVHTIKSNDLN